MTKKLIRPKKGRIFFGVAAGLGDYFDIDPTIFRILFVILTIWGGIGLLLYVVGIFIIPDENGDGIEEEAKEIKKRNSQIKEKVQKRTQTIAEEVRLNEKEQKSNSKGMILGIIILGIGAMLLINNLFPWFSWNRFWPIALIVTGILIMTNAKNS